VFIHKFIDQFKSILLVGVNHGNSSNKELGNIECINGKNFHMWKFQMRAIFMGKEVLGIVDESKVEPTSIGIAQAN